MSDVPATLETIASTVQTAIDILPQETTTVTVEDINPVSIPRPLEEEEKSTHPSVC